MTRARFKLLSLIPLLFCAPVLPSAPTSDTQCNGLKSAQRAACLDQRARKLADSGETRQALQLWQASLASNDGTTRLHWVSPEPGSGWDVAIGPGDGRLERAALAALEAGATEQARDWLARALALGAGDAAREAWQRSGGGSLSGLVTDPVPLTVEPWFRPLPDVEIPLFDAEPFRVRQARGKVLVLDFWASWCAPCAEELPLLQELIDAEQDRGVMAIAVNGQEPEGMALPFARELGLTMPIGRYTPELEQVYVVSSLPTLLVADQKGRVRQRWDGYRPGLEDEVAALVSELLDSGGNPGSDQTIARQLRGPGLFEVDWSRELEESVNGVAIVDAPGGEARALLSLGRKLGVYGEGGLTIRRWDSTHTAAALRRSRREGDRDYTLAGFRPGGSEVAHFTMPEGNYETFEAPGPVLDVELASIDGAPASLLLGTTEGLHVRQGETLRRLDGIAQALDMEVLDTPGGTRVLVLTEASGRRSARWLDDKLQTLSEQPMDDDAFHLVVDPARPQRFGTVPFAVVSSATGSFFEGGARQAALATRDGQVVVVDLEGGEERWRADWPGVTGLAAGDTDLDGTDELFVISGRRITVLRSRARGNDS